MPQCQFSARFCSKCDRSFRCTDRLTRLATLPARLEPAESTFSTTLCQETGPGPHPAMISVPPPYLVAPLIQDLIDVQEVKRRSGMPPGEADVNLLIDNFCLQVQYGAWPSLALFKQLWKRMHFSFIHQVGHRQTGTSPLNASSRAPHAVPIHFSYAHACSLYPTQAVPGPVQPWDHHQLLYSAALNRLHTDKQPQSGPFLIAIQQVMPEATAAAIPLHPPQHQHQQATPAGQLMALPSPLQHMQGLQLHLETAAMEQSPLPIMRLLVSESGPNPPLALEPPRLHQHHCMHMAGTLHDQHLHQQAAPDILNGCHGSHLHGSVQHHPQPVDVTHPADPGPLANNNQSTITNHLGSEFMVLDAPSSPHLALLPVLDHVMINNHTLPDANGHHATCTQQQPAAAQDYGYPLSCSLLTGVAGDQVSPPGYSQHENRLALVEPPPVFMQDDEDDNAGMDALHALVHGDGDGGQGLGHRIPLLAAPDVPSCETMERDASVRALSACVGALYTLHCLRGTQLTTIPTRVYLPVAKLEQLVELVPRMMTLGLITPVQIIYSLSSQNSFLIGALDCPSPVNYTPPTPHPQSTSAAISGPAANAVLMSNPVFRGALYDIRSSLSSLVDWARFTALNQQYLNARTAVFRPVNHQSHPSQSGPRFIYDEHDLPSQMKERVEEYARKVAVALAQGGDKGDRGEGKRTQPAEEEDQDEESEGANGGSPVQLARPGKGKSKGRGDLGRSRLSGRTGSDSKHQTDPSPGHDSAGGVGDVEGVLPTLRNTLRRAGLLLEVEEVQEVLMGAGAAGQLGRAAHTLQAVMERSTAQAQQAAALLQDGMTTLRMSESDAQGRGQGVASTQEGEEEEEEEEDDWDMPDVFSLVSSASAQQGGPAPTTITTQSADAGQQQVVSSAGAADDGPRPRTVGGSAAVDGPTAGKASGDKTLVQVAVSDASGIATTPNTVLIAVAANTSSNINIQPPPATTTHHGNCITVHAGATTTASGSVQTSLQDTSPGIPRPEAATVAGAGRGRGLGRSRMRGRATSVSTTRSQRRPPNSNADGPCPSELDLPASPAPDGIAGGMHKPLPAKRKRLGTAGGLADDGVDGQGNGLSNGVRHAIHGDVSVGVNVHVNAHADSGEGGAGQHKAGIVKRVAKHS